MTRGGALRAYLIASADAPDAGVLSLVGHAQEVLDRPGALEHGDWVTEQWLAVWSSRARDAGAERAVRLLCARLSLYRGDFEDARSRYELESEATPDDVRVLEGLGEALWRTGDPPAAVDVLKRARRLAEGPGDRSRLTTIEAKLAQALAAAGRHEEALEFVSTRLSPEHRCARALLVTAAASYLAVERFEDAIEAAVKAQARWPDDVNAALIEARALVGAGRPDQAIAAADRAASLDPDAADVRLVRLLAMVASGRQTRLIPASAGEYLAASPDPEAGLSNTRALLATSDPVAAAVVTAALLVALRRHAEALEELDQVGVELGDASTAAALTRGAALAGVGDGEAAGAAFLAAADSLDWLTEAADVVDILRSAVDMRPADSLPRRQLAEALRLRSFGESTDQALETVREAVECWDIAAALQAPRARNAIDYQVKALLDERLSYLMDVGRVPLWWDAIAWLEQALLLNQYDWWTFAQLARLFRTLDQPACALQAIDEGFALNPNDPDLLEEHGAVLCNLGRFGDALETLQRRLDQSLDPWALYLKAFALGGLQRFDEAVDALDRVTEGAARDVTWHAERAKALRLAGKLQPAMAEYRWVSDEERTATPEVRASVAWANYYLGETERARSSFERLLDDPAEDRANSLLGIGLSQLVAGSLVQGEAAVLESIELTRSERMLEAILWDDLDGLGNPLADFWTTEAGASAAERIRSAIERRRQALTEPASPEEELERVVEAAATAAGAPWEPVGAHIALARLHRRAQRYARALDEWSLLVDSGSVTELPAGLDGLLYEIQLRRRSAAGGFDAHEANADLHTAIELLERAGVTESLVRALGDLAEIQLLSESPGASAGTFGRALALLPEGEQERVRLLLERALAWELAGDHDAARRDIDTCADLIPAGEEAQTGSQLGTRIMSVLPDVDAYWRFDRALAEGGRQLPCAALDEVRRGLGGYLDARFGATGRDPSEYAGPPLPLPISLALGNALIPEDTGSDWELFRELLPAMRERLEAETGLLLPGVRVRSDSSEAHYVISLDEVPAVRGIAEADAASSSRAALEQVVGELERLIRANLSLFTGIDEMRVLLEVDDSGDASDLLSPLSPVNHRIGVIRVFRALADEQVPLKPRRSLRSVLSASPPDGDADLALRRARRLLLAGAFTAADVTAAPAELERDILRWTGAGAHAPLLAAPCEDAEALAAAAGRLIGQAPGDSALLVEAPAARRPLWALLHRAGIDAKVLAREELS